MIRTPEGERLIDAFSTHWIKYLAPTLILVLLAGTSILLFYLAGLSAHHSEALSHSSFISALLLLLIVHHWFFHKIMSEAMVDILITNMRFIYMKDCLLFCEDMHELSLERVRAVEAREHGVLQNIFRYGSLWFDTGGSDIGTRLIPLIPHPHRKAKEIMQLLEMK